MTSSDCFRTEIVNVTLINYWTFSNLIDTEGNQNLSPGSNYLLTCDRYNNTMSAIYLNNAFFQVLSKMNFSRDFTIITWINVVSLNQFITIYNFSTKNLEISLRYMESKLTANFKSSCSSNTTSLTISIELGTWIHVALVLNDKKLKIYFNGNQTQNATLSTLTDEIITTSNYIGKSENANGNAIYDEIRIYRGAFTSDEIYNDFKNGSLGGLYYN